MTKKTSVAVLGCTGYVGIELIKIDTLYDAASAIFGSKLLSGDKQ